MGFDIYPPISSFVSDKWELVASSTPNAASLNFTGISGYKKLKLVMAGNVVSMGLESLRFNADSSAKYTYSGFKVIGNNSVNFFAGTFAGGTGNMSTEACDYIAFPARHFEITIDSCDNNNLKPYEIAINTSPFQTETWRGQGVYAATASISQVNLVWNSNFNNTVWLYGVKA